MADGEDVGFMVIENNVKGLTNFVNSARLQKDMVKACALLCKINLGLSAYKGSLKLFEYLHKGELFEEFVKPLVDECKGFEDIVEKK